MTNQRQLRIGVSPVTGTLSIFVLDGEPFYTVAYWEEGDYKKTQPSLEPFRGVMRSVKSRFFTMDIAKRKDEGWMIVELGDAQVAGLPEHVDIARFYRTLAQRLL